MSLKGKTSRKLANGQKIYEFEKEIDLMGYFEYVLGLYACILPLYSNKCIGIYLRSRMSVYRANGPLVLTFSR